MEGHLSSPVTADSGALYFAIFVLGVFYGAVIGAWLW
jgi:hypothetical protein